jgi:hypothetical protein
MKQSTTQDNGHFHLHTRENGVQVYVTTEHLRRINNRKKQYRRGSLPPNYPLPVDPSVTHNELTCELCWAVRREHG